MSGQRGGDRDDRRRQEFCRRVLENLSDIVDGEAPEDFCREVEEVLGECEAYSSFRRSFEDTIRLTQALGDLDPAGVQVDEAAYRKCVEAVRGRLTDGGEKLDGNRS